MKIFLTGQSGFIGKNISEYYSNNNQLFFYKRNSDITFELENFKPDIIIHSAAEIYKNEEMFDSNVVLTYNILEYCRKNNIVKLIYLGSSSEYGKVDEKMSENLTCNPYSIYAATKSCGTLLCQSYSRVYKFQCAIIRPFSVFGKYEPQHRLIPKLFESSLTGKKIELINGNHDFIYIKDFLLYFDLILKTPEENFVNIYNIGSGNQYSNLEVLKIIEDITNKKINFTLKKETKIQDSDLWVCDNSLIYKKFGSNINYTLQQGLIDYYNLNKQFL